MNSNDFKNYFNDLKARHPLNEQIPVTFEMVPQVLHNGFRPRGLATMKGNSINIKVSTYKQHPMLIIKAIAHEYRHAMQWINMGLKSNGISDPTMEHDANRFGQLEVNMFMARG